MCPLYDYRCSLCEHEEEFMLKYDENLNIMCPKCGEMELERMITGTSNFEFKGEGTYDTGTVKHGKGARNYIGGLKKP
jgi:putative FmdB family regulatory protein